MSSGRTVESLLSSARGDAVALLAPHTKPLTYADRRGLVGQTIASMNKCPGGYSARRRSCRHMFCAPCRRTVNPSERRTRHVRRRRSCAAMQ
jgi:hypothetical protein